MSQLRSGRAKYIYIKYIYKYIKYIYKFVHRKKPEKEGLCVYHVNNTCVAWNFQYFTVTSLICFFYVSFTSVWCSLKIKKIILSLICNSLQCLSLSCFYSVCRKCWLRDNQLVKTEKISEIAQTGIWEKGNMYHDKNKFSQNNQRNSHCLLKASYALLGGRSIY